MIKINTSLTPESLHNKISKLFDLSAVKIRSLEQSWKPAHGAPVLTALTASPIYTPAAIEIEILPTFTQLIPSSERAAVNRVPARVNLTQ